MNRERGFSLIEILLVAALIAVASGLAVAAISGGAPGVQLRSQAREIAAQLRFTRARALASGEAQRFTIVPAEHSWHAPEGRNGQISKRMDVSFTGARELMPQAGEGAIVFFPRGHSTGGAVRVAMRGSAWDVEAAWLTGEVRIRRVEASQ